MECTGPGQERKSVPNLTERDVTRKMPMPRMGTRWCTDASLCWSAAVSQGCALALAGEYIIFFYINWYTEMTDIIESEVGNPI